MKSKNSRPMIIFNFGKSREEIKKLCVDNNIRKKVLNAMEREKLPSLKDVIRLANYNGVSIDDICIYYMALPPRWTWR